MKSAEPGRLQSIQFLRGIAACMVLVVHSVGRKYFAGDAVFSDVVYNGRMGVHLFFIISGFVIPYSMYSHNYRLTDIKSFFIKRFARIEPPYIVSVVLVLIVDYFKYLSPWGDHKFKPDIWNWVGHLGYLNAYTRRPWLNRVYWSLAVEFEFYILIALVYVLIVHRNKVIQFITYFVLLAATFIKVPFGRDHLLTYLPFFLSGTAMFLYMVNKVSLKEFLVMMLVTLPVCLYVHDIKLLVLTMGALWCIYYIKSVPKPFLWLGAISFSLYLTHTIIISRFMAFAFMLLPGRALYFALLPCMIFCVAFAYIFYIAVEKPSLKLSKRVRFRHPDPEGENIKT